MRSAFLLGILFGASVLEVHARFLALPFFAALVFSVRFSLRPFILPFFFGVFTGIFRTFFQPVFIFSSDSLFPELRLFLSAALQSFLPEPESALAIGLLLGGSSSFPQALRDAFKATGLLHIVAVSGYNVSLIVAFLLAACNPLPRRWRAIIACLSIAFFLFLVGLSEATTRAACMGILVLVGRFMGRPRDTVYLLSLTAVFFVFLDGNVVSSASFQLSFFATFGLLHLTDRITQWFLWLPKSIAVLFASTLAAQFMTLPILLITFGFFSLSAPFVNFLVLPLVPFAMLFSAITLASVFVLPMFILPFSLAASFVLWLILALTSAAAQFAPFKISFSFLPFPFLFLYYFFLFRIGTVKAGLSPCREEAP